MESVQGISDAVLRKQIFPITPPQRTDQASDEGWSAIAESTAC